MSFRHSSVMKTLDERKYKMEKDENTKPDSNDTLRLLEIVGSWKDKEGDRFWNRFNFIFLINSALLAAALLAQSTSTSPPPLHLFGKLVSIVSILSVLGIFVSVIWFFLLRSAKEYEARLIKSIDRILEDVPAFKTRVCGYSD